MDRPLHLLIVDDRPDSVYLLSEFLLKRGHRVEVSSEGRESLAAVARRRAKGDPYDLVLANVRLKDLDGLTLLRELRAQRDPTPIALIDAFADVDAVTYRDAESLGCLCFLDKPIDLQRVEQLLGQVRGTGAHKAQPGGIAPPSTDRVLHGSDQFAARPRTTTAFRPATKPDSGPFSGTQPQLPAEPAAPGPRDEPFFGTARIARPPGSGTERVTRKPATAPGVNPFTESFPPHPAPNAHAIDSTRPRTEPLAGITDTARIRRGVTGSVRNPAIDAAAAAPGSAPGALERRVVCAACRREFLVAYRDHEFTVNCVHCGQLNRVQPRAAR